MNREKLSRLEEWLQDRITDAPDLKVVDCKLAAGGYSAETFFATIDLGGERASKTLVIRKETEGLSLFLDSDVALPFRIMKALERHPGVPAPRAVGMELDLAVLGAPFMVMEKVEGRVPPQKIPYPVDGWVKDLHPDQRGLMWRNALTTLGKLHGIDWQDGFSFLNPTDAAAPGPEQYVNRVKELHAWATAGRSFGVIDIAMDYFSGYRAAPVSPSVLWGDAQPCNMIFNDDMSVAAVLDWEAASLGPAEADLGWWLLFEEFYLVATGADALSGVPSRQEQIAIYETALGRKVQDLEFYEIGAMIRMAMVIVRSMDRYVELGAIPATSSAGTHNPVTTLLARKLKLPAPEPLPDFNEMLLASSTGG